MKKLSFNTVTIAIAILSLIVSSVALYVSWSQYNIDYDKSILIQPGTLPLAKITEGQMSLDLDVINTSKSNLQYFIRARTNMGCLKGTNDRPLFYTCSYESQVVSLSKPSTGNNTYRHTLNLDVRHGAVETNPLAYLSPAEYYLHIQIIDAGNGRALYNTKCFYSFHIEAKVFTLDQSVIDTSCESEKRQEQCHA